MLKCVSPYKSSLGVYAVGDIVDDATLEQALVFDSPGSFAAYLVEPELEDKMLRGKGAKR